MSISTPPLPCQDLVKNVKHSVLYLILNGPVGAQLLPQNAQSLGKVNMLKNNFTAPMNNRIIETRKTFLSDGKLNPNGETLVVTD